MGYKEVEKKIEAMIELVQVSSSLSCLDKSYPNMIMIYTVVLTMTSHTLIQVE